MTVRLRPEAPADEPFLRRLIVATAAAELGADSWPEAMRSHLLGLQYTGRRFSHRGSFPDAASMVVVADDIDAGWVVVAAYPDEVHLAEIMVAGELRGRGIGSEALRQILAEAAGRPVRLTVNVTNAGAIRLYERLGFRKVGGDEVQHAMERSSD